MNVKLDMSISMLKSEEVEGKLTKRKLTYFSTSTVDLSFLPLGEI